MIYILAGNDTKKKNIYIKTITKNRDVISVPAHEATKELLDIHALGVSMFGESPAIMLENIISSNTIILSDQDLKKLQDSQTIFIFNEDKLLVASEKKYKKYAEIMRFEEKIVAKKPVFNTFAIADAFGVRDKVKAWILYREAIEAGIEPEPISGILFWKIKSMILSGKPSNNLKKQSSALVSLYHRAHRGECDFVIGLEQFILSSLSK